MGLTFAYRSNFCLMLTATLFGVPGRGIVVVGPLRQQSESSRTRHVSSGMKVPPFFSLLHHSDPASQLTSSTLAPLTSITERAASTSSGPVPSPLMTATFFKVFSRPPRHG